MSRRLLASLDLVVASRWKYFSFIVLFSIILKVLYFTLGKGVFDFYDALSYIANGVCFIRDGAPWPVPVAYDDLEKGLTFCSKTAVYPNHLYSIIIGLFFKVIGKVSVLYAAYLASFISIIGNVFLGFTIKKFFPNRHAIFVLILTLINYQIWINTNRPITDPWGWTILMVIFWGVFTNRINGFAVGILLGIAGLIRGQMFQFLPLLPLLRQDNETVSDFAKDFLKISLGTLISVFAFKAIFFLFVETQDNTVEFYINHMRYCLNITTLPQIIKWFSFHFNRLFNRMYFPVAFLFTVLFLFKSKNKQSNITKRTAIFAIISVLLPLLYYSIITLGVCDPRYYIYAIPLFYIIAYEFVLNNITNNIKNIAMFIFIVSSIYSGILFLQKGISDLSCLSKTAIYREKMDTVDLHKTEKFVRENFDKDAILVSNHCLLSAYHPSRNLISLPMVEKFKEGSNNHLIDGIVIMTETAMITSLSPNWFTLDSITDNKGNTFVCVFRERKRILTSAVFKKLN